MLFKLKTLYYKKGSYLLTSNSFIKSNHQSSVNIKSFVHICKQIDLQIANKSQLYYSLICLFLELQFASLTS